MNYGHSGGVNKNFRGYRGTNNRANANRGSYNDRNNNSNTNYNRFNGNRRNNYNNQNTMPRPSYNNGSSFGGSVAADLSVAVRLAVAAEEVAVDTSAVVDSLLGEINFVT